ncbi:retrovirus-related pol polyprotein from transposon TNT 1-94 [Tanacetum coccineum]
MYKLDLQSLSPKLKKNKEAHVDYLKQTKEHADTLHDIVKQARALKSLDNVLDYACKFTTRIQELLVYVSATCPSSRNDSVKLVAVTPMNKSRQVRFAEPSTSTRNHDMCVVDYLHDMNVRTRAKSVKSSKKNEWKPTGKVFTNVGHRWLPTGRTFTIDGTKCPLTRITSTKIVPPKKPVQTKCSQLINFVSKFMRTVRFENDQVEAIMGYGDYHIGNVTISRVYYVGLGYNLFSMGQFCDFDLEVAFCKHLCFVRDFEGVDLLKGSRSTNLYTLLLENMLKSSPMCLLSKASKTKSWLWHRRLSHLNFSIINQLAKQGLVRGLSKLKYEKYHLCSACSLGKSKKHTHKPKSENSIQEKLYLLHMDLCEPMRIESINDKKYILVIVDDYSRFTWVKFLRSNDKTLEFIIKFLKLVQVHLNATVRNLQTDNGTKFVN